MYSCFKKFLGRHFIEGCFDCWGFIEEFYAQFGYFFDCSFRYKQSTVKPADIGFRYFKDWHRIDKPRTGDLVIFKHKGHLYHGGVMLTSRTFMHNMENVGVVVSKINTGWRNRVYGFYRLNNETDILKDNR